MPRPRLAAHVVDVQQAMSIRYNNRVYEMQRAGREVIVMSLGEAFFDVPLFTIDDLPFPAIYHYSHSRGLPELREKIAAYFGTEYDVPVDPEREILVTAGSKAAIHMAFMAVLEPGDEVIIPEPAWVSYPEQVRLCHGVPVMVQHDCSTTQLANHVTDRTKAVVLTNPHNPRGYVYTREELTFILALAEDRGFWVLCDEAYSDFVPDHSFLSIGSIDREKSHAVIFNSISKNYGISGWRIGYVIANPGLVDQILKINQHLITCPPTVLSHYVAKHFDEILEITKPQIQGVLDRRAALARYMDEIGLSYFAGNATFYFFVSIAPSRLGSEAFCSRLLEESGVSVVPGVGYGLSCDSFIRVSVGTATMEQNLHGLDCIRALVSATSPDAL